MLSVCILSKGHSFFPQVCWPSFAVLPARNYRMRFRVDSIWRMAGASRPPEKPLGPKIWC